MKTRHLVAALFAVPLLLGATTAFAANLEGEQAAFRPITPGGLVSGTSVYSVTSLENSGPGSLAEALAQPGPKVIVFDVGGVIEIDQNVSIETPFTTIAGETAPSPGITLDGAGLQIRSHDIVVRHIAVRVRPSDDPDVNGVLDGLSIGGNPERYGTPIRNVLLENVSVSWGVDENVSVWDSNTGNVQLRSLIIAEALDDAGHPKGTHSKGMLIGSGADNVSVEDSLFAHNVDRQPRVSPDAQVDVVRNVVYNPRQVGIEIFVNCETAEPPRRIAMNVLLPGEDTYDQVKLYNFNNYDVDIGEFGDEDCPIGWTNLDFEIGSDDDQRAVTASVVAHSGTRPNDRNSTDMRILNEVVAGEGSIRDEPTDEVSHGDGSRAFVMPPDPFAVENGRMAIEAALCRAHLRLGGLPSETCR